jgi:hypothetical protein
MNIQVLFVCMSTEFPISGNRQKLAAEKGILNKTDISNGIAEVHVGQDICVRRSLGFAGARPGIAMSRLRVLGFHPHASRFLILYFMDDCRLLGAKEMAHKASRAS